MTSLVTKFTSSAASTYQQVELALLTRNGKAGKVARAVKATFMSLSTICNIVRANGTKMLKDNFGRIAPATLTALWQGGVGDSAMVIARLASPWGYIPHVMAAGCMVHKVLTKPFDTQTISHSTAASLFKGIFLSAFTPTQITVFSGFGVITSQRWLYPRSWTERIPMELLSEPDSNTRKMITSSACVYLIGGAPGITVGHLLLEGLSSLTNFKPIFDLLFEENYALLEAQLLVKHLEKEGKKFTTITYIVRQYLDLEPSDPTVEQQHERVAALYDRTATAAATDTSHKKTD